MSDPSPLLQPILRVQAEIRDAVVAACEAGAGAALSGIAREAEGDTVYGVDRVGEDRLLDLFDREVAVAAPLVLVAEGLDPRGVVLPRGAVERDAAWRVIVDPVDGTRGLMYQKRSAWILTGVAPNLAAGATLHDVVLAAQTEVPLVKQHLSDRLGIDPERLRLEWISAAEGKKYAETMNEFTEQIRALGPLDLNEKALVQEVVKDE